MTFPRRQLATVLTLAVMMGMSQGPSTVGAETAHLTIRADEGTETEEHRSRMEALVQASQAMATRLYQQAAAEQSSTEQEDFSNEDEDIVEAEIVDEDDES